jgi:tRNA splicing ligase
MYLFFKKWYFIIKYKVSYYKYKYLNYNFLTSKLIVYGVHITGKPDRIDRKNQ